MNYYKLEFKHEEGVKVFRGLYGSLNELYKEVSSIVDRYENVHDVVIIDCDLTVRINFSNLTRLCATSH